MLFTKMQGLGNDYIYVNCLDFQLTNPSFYAKKLSDRHFGIGSDGLILIKRSYIADYKMEIYNSDGTEAEMCGNGIRCVGKYLYENGICKNRFINIETLAGIKKVELIIEKNHVSYIKVNMGKAEFDKDKIPVIFTKKRVVNEMIEVNNQMVQINCVSMGNPHCVIFVENIEKYPVEEIGSTIELMSIFPNRTNVEFVEVKNNKEIKVRVFERGSKETYACGTGACACVAVGINNGILNEEVLVKLKGGNLYVTQNELTNEICLSGTATIVYNGSIEI